MDVSKGYALGAGHTGLATRLQPMCDQWNSQMAKDRSYIVRLVAVAVEKSQDQNRSQTGFLNICLVCLVLRPGCHL